MQGAGMVKNYTWNKQVRKNNTNQTVSGIWPEVYSWVQYKQGVSVIGWVGKFMDI